MGESLNPTGGVPETAALTSGAERYAAATMSRKVNVLFVVSQPTSTPAVSVHANLMRFLNPDRVKVHVVYNVLAASERHRSAGDSVLDVLPQTPAINLRAARFGPVGGAPGRELLAATVGALGPTLRDGISLVRYIQREHIDIIHCEEGARSGAYAYALSRLTRARWVLHFHAQYGNWMSAVSRQTVRRADAIIAVSDWSARVMEQGGVPPERIFPILNGIDITQWDPATANGDGVRREFGVGPGDPLVVMVAQLTAWKRQSTLIEAFRHVVDKHPCARLMLVGKEWNPPARLPEEVSYVQELERLVIDAQLGQNVTFAGQRRDISAILAAADVFALPSVGEPCGLAHIEAMAMAKPVVTVHGGGGPELVQHDRTGLVGPPDDTKALAANLIALIDDPPRRHEMGHLGRRRVLEYLNAKRMADEVEGVYRLVVGLPRV